MLREFLRDVSQSWSACLRHPGFSLAVVLLLGLGIGGSTVMFSVLDGALFRPVALPHADELVLISGAATPPGGDRLAWWSQAKTLAGLATFSSGGANLTASGQAERVQASVVSAGYFRVILVEPTLGRTFLPDEQTPGRNQVAVLNHAFAVARFGTAAGALRQTLGLNGVPFTVVGVMPPGLEFPGRTDIWVPKPRGAASLDLGSTQTSGSPFWGEVLIGRVRAGVRLREARGELNVMHHRLESTYKSRGIAFGQGVTLSPLKKSLTREVRPALLALFAAALFVLLIACANAASLLLARAASRQKEMAVRMCLGAGRDRVFGQLLMESVVLALGGGTAGVFIATSGVDLFRAIAPGNIPGLSGAGINIRVLAFALGVSLFTGLVVGLVPALQTFTPDIARALRADAEWSAGPVRQRLRSFLVIAEVAAALVLTVGTGLMVESLQRLSRVAPGFDPRNVLTAELALPTAKYAIPAREGLPSRAPGPQNRMPPKHRATRPPDSRHVRGEPLSMSESAEGRIGAFHRMLFGTIRDLPGVIAAGAVSDLPLGGANSGGELALDVRGVPQLETAAAFTVAGDYFAAMAIPLRAGRPFSEADASTASPVVIVNETLARRCWGARNPVGNQLRLEGEPTLREVIGVVGNVKYGDLGEPPAQQIYLPWFQPFRYQEAGAAQLNMTLVVRAASDPKGMMAPMREAVTSLDSDLPLFHVHLMEEVLHQSTGPPRLRAILLAAFAAVALVLAALGVYGVATYSVARRTHEIGLRVSLGAGRRDIFLLVVGEGARLALAGIAVGSAASLALNTMISGLLFGISASDPTTLVTSGVSLLGAALIASAVPAARAMSVDPAVALRYE